MAVTTLVWDQLNGRFQMLISCYVDAHIIAICINAFKLSILVLFCVHPIRME